MSDRPPDPPAIAPVDPADRPPRFRWRLLPTIWCGLAALYCGLFAIGVAFTISSFYNSPLPEVRERWPLLACVLGQRTAMALAWGATGAFCWRGGRRAAGIALGAVLLFWLSPRAFVWLAPEAFAPLP